MRNIDPSIRRRHAAIEEKLIPQTSAQSWSGRICSPRTIQSRRLPRCAPTAGSLIGIDFSSSHGDRPGKMTQRPERRRNVSYRRSLALPLDIAGSGPRQRRGWLWQLCRQYRNPPKTDIAFVA